MRQELELQAMAEALMTVRSSPHSAGLVNSRPAMAAVCRLSNLAILVEPAGSRDFPTLTNGTSEGVCRRGVRSRVEPSMRSMICEAHARSGGLGSGCISGCCSLPSSSATFQALHERTGGRGNNYLGVLRKEKSPMLKVNSVRCGGASPSDVGGERRLSRGGRRFRLQSKKDVGTSIRNEDDEMDFAGFARGRPRARAGRKKSGKVKAFWKWGDNDMGAELSEAEEVEAELMGPLNSIGDFTRFMDNGDNGAELQTAIVTYRKPFPWNLISNTQVQFNTSFTLWQSCVRQKFGLLPFMIHSVYNVFMKNSPLCIFS